MTLEELEQKVAAHTTWINSVIANSKRSSELTEKTSITDSSERYVIQKGTEDAKGVGSSILRGIKGDYNAATNTPTLVNGTGIEGDTYKVGLAGTNDYGNGAVSAPSGAILIYLSGQWTVPTSKLSVLVDSFVATHNQTSFTVTNAGILDDGLWSVQVGSALLNSTTGMTDFVNGGITIDFATGEITFLNAIQGGTQVIIKYN